MTSFSVLMSIYKNTRLCELEQCMESLFSQTLCSDDIVIVFDGPVQEDVERYLDGVQAEHGEVSFVKYEENRGLGLALNNGLLHCKNELVARMDADDVAVADRFQKQSAVFESDGTISVVGGNIAEFTGSTDNVVSHRNVPEAHSDICAFLKKRCPFNHMTVMFKKSDVIAAGNYADWHFNEDYDLWIRMYLSGCKFYNIQSDLVFARVDSVMDRRGGYGYYKSERDIFKLMYKNKMISFFAYLKAKTIRFVAYVMVPNGLRAKLFKKFLRQK